MTDRELMQMALDALDSDNPHIQVGAAISLRYRLAQPEPEPVAQCSYPKCQATNGCVGVCSKTAPPKREWVGLTYEEVKKIVDLNTDYDYGYDIWCNGRAVARDVEAKLKEKNT